jgi:hypothetical protein
MNLQRVRKNMILVFPYGFPEVDRFRGKAGYIVDLDAPCEATWCKDQEFKFEPALDADKASPIVHPIAVRAVMAERARLAAEASKPKTEEKEPALVGASTGESESLEVKRPARKAS